MSTKQIDCGKRKVQNNYRVALTDILKAHNVKPGDEIEVVIHIKEQKTYEPQTETPWLEEFMDIHYKWRNLNIDKLDIEKVRNLEKRLNAIEPQIIAFSPKDDDWGSINMKKGIMADLGFMKAFFKRCE